MNSDKTDKSYYEIFSGKATKDTTARVNLQELKTYEDLKAKTETEDFDGLYFIINNKTKNAVIIDKDSIFATNKKDLEKLFQEKNIMQINTNDIMESKDITDESKSCDLWNDRLYSTSYNFNFPILKSLRPYYYYYRNNDQIPKKNLHKKDKYCLYRIVTLGVNLLFRNDMMFLNNNPNNLPKDNEETKLDRIFINKKSSMPMYRELFIDAPLTFTITPSRYGYSGEFEYEDTYFTTNYEDYADKTYGVIINLNKVSILKKQTDGYEMVNKNHSTQSTGYRSYYSHIFFATGISEFMNFMPATNDAEFNAAQERLMTKLKNNYTRTYNRVSAGFKAFKERQNDSRPFTFTLSSGSKGAFVISDLRRNDLTVIDTYESQRNVNTIKDIFYNISKIDKDDWMILKDRIFINKSLLKENKDSYEYSLETKTTYYNSYLKLSIKFGKHKFCIDEPTQEIIEQFYQAGAFDEDKSNMLKCELLLKESA